MQNINKQLSELNSTLSDAPIDMFICSASFEDRCKSITDSLGTLQIEGSIVAYNRFVICALRVCASVAAGPVV